MEVPNDWSAEKSTRNQKSQPVNQKSQPVNQKSQSVNQNAEKSTRTQQKCDRVALSGKIPLSSTFQVPKSPLRGKNSSGGQNESCAITAQRWDNWNTHQSPPEVSPFCPSYSYGLRPPAIPTHDILLST
ncbi:hypothetical protein LR48_Vigan562s000200 [Vigna angularis]|uniref:Uncharacterized protein n=1 Tax=Phaseolus angularis TaxID=3914 RepID=A0A0L9TDJ1_PHAAN|nr:hypothetical protein LR48_Vigan562s000200 [Vigna angularis]